ncbi:MAG: hypothetical protein EXX96DRAFT_586603 [Benjaminiella poitrasii]|nr:MAG: hypothetical protein EXX96DRAFT_586603 [Benjaminiella poitrasii]
MFLKLVQAFIILAILTSFLLQLLSLLGNFKGLRSVYFARVDLYRTSSNSNSLGGSLLDSIPDYFTMALFIVCQNEYGGQHICTPSSFGYRYGSKCFFFYEIKSNQIYIHNMLILCYVKSIDTTQILELLREQISPHLQSVLTGLQGGVFILSVIFCFILLCAYIIHLATIHRVKYHYSWFRKLILPILALISLLLCIATFVIQIVIYNIVKNKINTAKNEMFGGLINLVLYIRTSIGRAAWMSLAAFILLFIVTILLCFTLWFLSHPKRTRRTREDSYGMSGRVY